MTLLIIIVSLPVFSNIRSHFQFIDGRTEITVLTLTLFSYICWKAESEMITGASEEEKLLLLRSNVYSGLSANVFSMLSAIVIRPVFNPELLLTVSFTDCCEKAVT